MSIHHVSDDTERADYYLGMADTDDAWKKWGARYRQQIKERGTSLAKVAEKMDRAESTLRSWTNKNRKVNLAEFFELCTAGGVDPAMVLFGQPLMTEAIRKSLGEAATSILEADPAARATYAEFGDSVRKSVRARKAAEARASSRLKP